MVVHRASPGYAALRALLEPLGQAPAELLARRRLLRRTDSKFLLPASELDAVLSGLEGNYLVLAAGAHGIARYETLYYDTPELRCFHDHRRGRRLRQKVRVRRYPDRQVSFLEVKTRRSDLVSFKHRLELPCGDEQLGDRERAFLAEHCRFPIADLAPQVSIHYLRVALLGANTDERVTVDIELGYRHDDAAERLDGVAILEVKQATFSGGTPVMRALRARGRRPGSMSKYCTGLALTRAGLRRNRFLPTLRAIERMRA